MQNLLFLVFLTSTLESSVSMTLFYKFESDILKIVCLIEKKKNRESERL
jgi:hypothetical protein